MRLWLLKIWFWFKANFAKHETNNEINEYYAGINETRELDEEAVAAIKEEMDRVSDILNN